MNQDVDLFTAFYIILIIIVGFLFMGPQVLAIITLGLIIAALITIIFN